VSSEFVAAMEDVLEVYAEPYDPTRPKVNCDETSKQLIKETSQPLPAQPGQPQRFAYEYERNGTRNLLLFVEPQTGKRHGHVTEQRTKVDFAHEMQWLVDICHPEAEVLRVVLDNLNTPKMASLYEAFEPAEARRIARKLELHYTPKHGSWLNMADIELSVLQPQCLDRRIPDTDTLKSEIAAWEHQRNAEHATIDWRFSVTDARKKLKRLYPSLPA
jgi:DDE superfamily endonuclease